MAYPVVAMRKSALLDGQLNGRLDPDIMRTRTAGSGTVQLIHPAARSWAAMHADAKSDGITLGSVGSYRTYARQVDLFTHHYTKTYLPGRRYKVWQGRRWYQRYGSPVVAIPGTSNHGWGSAVDVESVTTVRLRWLLNNEIRFGWSHEVSTEPWHVRFWAGDGLTAAVRAYESNLQPKPPAPAPLPPPIEGNVDIFSITDTGTDSNFAIMPDGPVRLDEGEAYLLGLAGANPIRMPHALFQKLVSGPRYRSFEDAPTLE